MDRVCVIGAGSSGLAVLRELRARGITAEAIERRDDVGGLWRYSQDPEVGEAYASLHPNTSRARMQYRRFPMPADWPDFPPHRWIARYLEDYAGDGRLHEAIELGREVVVVSPLEGGGFEVELDGGERRHYRAVVVASGAAHGRRVVPSLPGRFLGRQLHSGAYRTPEELAGLRVCVVGLGASAADISVDLGRSAERVLLSARSGVWIVPRVFGSRPVDQMESPLSARIPMAVRRPAWRATVRLFTGRYSDYGLPEPSYAVHRGPYTVTSSLLPSIRLGLVWPRPGLAALEPDGVVFADGSRDRVDAIVWCTGYEVHAPFLAPELIAGGWCPELYLRLVHPDVDGLFFAGLLQPIGSTFPIAEAQGRFIADVLDGAVALPEPAARRVAAAADAERQRRQFAQPSRGLLIEPIPYLRQLERTRRALQATPRPAPVRPAELAAVS